MAKDYATARGVLTLLEWIGYAVWLVGALLAGAALRLANAGAAGLAILIALVIGAIIVAMVQIARAQIDTALNTAAMLAELRRQG